MVVLDVVDRNRDNLLLLLTLTMLNKMRGIFKKNEAFSSEVKCQFVQFMSIY